MRPFPNSCRSGYAYTKANAHPNNRLPASTYRTSYLDNYRLSTCGTSSSE